MSTQVQLSLPSLYEEDETAWLEQMAELIAQGRLDELDREHLSEYLSDMARRDRREVYSRLRVLMGHFLRWEHEPFKRTNPWLGTIFSQQCDLSHLLESDTLRRCALELFEEAYRDAVELAAVETLDPPERLPSKPPWSLNELLQLELSS